MIAMLRTAIGRMGIAALLVSLFAPAAGATEPPPPPPVVSGPHKGPAIVTAASDAARADALTGQAKDAYRSGKFADALNLFELAFAAAARPALLYNIARTQEKLARYQQAIAYLKRYLELYRQQNGGADPANLADVQNLIETMRRRGYTSLPKVNIESRPPGALVTRASDGASLGSTPLTLHLPPGRHKLRLQLTRFLPMDAVVNVPESGQANFVFTLNTHQERAALSVWCNIRQVKIAIDGRVVAMTPLADRIDVRPGRHQVTLSRDGYGTREDVVEIPANRELHVRYLMQALKGSTGWRSAVGWPLLAAGVGGVAGGVVSWTKAEQFYTGTIDFKYWQDWQNIGYGAGGATAAVGLGFVLWDALRDSTPESDRLEGAQRVEGRELRPYGAALVGAP